MVRSVTLACLLVFFVTTNAFAETIRGKGQRSPIETRRGRACARHARYDNDCHDNHGG
jgi:hypothetical protein